MHCSLSRAALVAAALGVFFLAPCQARAAWINLGPAGDFNVFVFAGDTQHNTDVEGRVAVGGNADFLTGGGSGLTIGNSSPGNSYNLIVGGNLLTQFNTLHGGLLTNGNVNWNTPSITGNLAVNGNATFTGGGTINGSVNVVGTYTAPGYFPPNANPPSFTPLPFDFATVQAGLQSQSSYLASLAPNGTTTISFQQVLLNAAGPPLGLYVFDVTGADLAAAAGHGMSITAPVGSTVVVNIDGTTDSLASMGITLNGIDREHVLYNFFQATSLAVNSISVEGTILAPWANVNFATGQLNGSLIANSVTGGGESHLHLFQGTIPVPEPSSWVLAATAIAVGGLMIARRMHGGAVGSLMPAVSCARHLTPDP